MKLKAILLMLAVLILPQLAKADEPSLVDDKGTTVAAADTTPTTPAVSVNDILSHVKFNTGIGYDSKNNKIVNTDTIRLLGYSGFFLDPSIDVGYASNDNFVVGASFSLISAKKLGIDIPILDLIEIRPQVLYGWGNINLSDVAGSKNTVIYGASIIAIKW